MLGCGPLQRAAAARWGRVQRAAQAVVTGEHEGRATGGRRENAVYSTYPQLEVRIAAHVDYGAWEADFFAMQDLCRQRYQRWLQAKGVPEPYSAEFPFCVETYLNFIYQYDAGNLRDVSPEALAEFFLDYLLRKVMAKPPEYTQWPPARR